MIDIRNLILTISIVLAFLSGCGTTYYYDDEYAGSQTRPPSRPERNAGCETYLPLVIEIAERHRLDFALVAGVVETESRWKPRATSKVGARGLMQIMPSTGRSIGCGDLYEPESNIECGVRLLDRLISRYKGRVDFALSAYAMGARTPDRAFKNGDPPPRQSFIDAVMTRANRFKSGGCG
jgi:soluble lytic murein transglycosylase-like protein